MKFDASIKWNEINPRTPAGISHAIGVFHVRSTFHKSARIYFVEKRPLSIDKGLFLERTTRLELATSTLARWRSTRWATSAFRISCHLFRNVIYYNGDDTICQAYFWIFSDFFRKCLQSVKKLLYFMQWFLAALCEYGAAFCYFRRSYVYVL